MTRQAMKDEITASIQAAVKPLSGSWLARCRGDAGYKLAMLEVFTSVVRDAARANGMTPRELCEAGASFDWDTLQ